MNSRAKTTGSNSHLYTRLCRFIERLPQSIRRLQLESELALLEEFKLFDKVAAAVDTVSILRNAEIIHPVSASTTVSSLLCYTLDLNPSDPVSLELFFELMLTGKELLPVEFSVAVNQQDRLLSILQRRLQLRTSRGNWPLNPELAPITAYLPVSTHSRENFNESSYIYGILPAQPAFFHRNRIVFRPDYLLDIIQACAQQAKRSGVISDKQISGLQAMHTRYSDWNFSPHLQSMHMSHHWGLFDLLEKFQPESSAAAMLVTACYHQIPDLAAANDRCRMLLEEEQPLSPDNSFYCLSILEETGGKLVYREQFCHLLHHLGGFSRVESAVELWHAVNEHLKWKEPFKIRFIERAVRSGIHPAAAGQIAVMLTETAPALFSKETAYRNFLPIAVLQNFSSYHRHFFLEALRNLHL